MRTNLTLLTNKFPHYHRLFRFIPLFLLYAPPSFQANWRIQYNEYALFITHTIAVHSHSATEPNYNNHFNDFSNFLLLLLLPILSLCHTNKFFINKKLSQISFSVRKIRTCFIGSARFNLSERQPIQNSRGESSRGTIKVFYEYRKLFFLWSQFTHLLWLGEEFQSYMM